MRWFEMSRQDCFHLHDCKRLQLFFFKRYLHVEGLLYVLPIRRVLVFDFQRSQKSLRPIYRCALSDINWFHCDDGCMKSYIFKNNTLVFLLFIIFLQIKTALFMLHSLNKLWQTSTGELSHCHAAARINNNVGRNL